MPEVENQSPVTKGGTKLSTPWGTYQSRNILCSSNDEVTTGEFIRERTRLHELYIKEKERTKRIYLSIAAFLFVCSLLVIVFAPEGREKISYWVGATLLLFSGGAAGFTKIKAKGPLVEFGASSEKNDSPTEK